MKKVVSVTVSMGYADLSEMLSKVVKREQSGLVSQDYVDGYLWSLYDVGLITDEELLKIFNLILNEREGRRDA